MSKEKLAKRKQEILDSIHDQAVREHYRVQLEMAEALEAEGVTTAFHDNSMFVDEREDEKHERDKRIGQAMADRLLERRSEALRDGVREAMADRLPERRSEAQRSRISVFVSIAIAVGIAMVVIVVLTALSR